MKIYQLSAYDDSQHRTVTLVVTEDWGDLCKAASLAIGRQGWSLDDLTVVVWQNGSARSREPYA